MTLAKCAYCGIEQEDYLGTYLIKNDGSVVYYSSSKCMKGHLGNKRDRRKVRWTEAFKTAQKDRLAKKTKTKPTKKERKARAQHAEGKSSKNE